MHSRLLVVGVLSLVIGIVVGAGIIYASGSYKGGNKDKNVATRMSEDGVAYHHDDSDDHMEEMQMHGQQMMHDEMSADDTAVLSMDTMMHDMNMSLEGKTGADFDAEFLAQMIIHHQGAVEMAEAALERASSTELKAMATAIIEAQNTEISQMQSWQVEWFGVPEVQ